MNIIKTLYLKNPNLNNWVDWEKRKDIKTQESMLLHDDSAIMIGTSKPSFTAPAQRYTSSYEPITRSCSLVVKTWFSKDMLMPTGEGARLLFVEEEEETKLSCSGRFMGNPAFGLNGRSSWRGESGLVGSTSWGLFRRKLSVAEDRLCRIDWADDIGAPSSGLKYRNWR